MGEIYRDEVLSVAAKEIGYLEKATDWDLDSKTANPGNGNWTKYARDLWQAVPHYYQSNKNGYDWCAVFVDWCVYVASGRDSVRAQAAKYFTGPYGAGCDWCVLYYKEAGAWYAEPKPGDQIFFGSVYAAQHTGLVEYVKDGVIHTIEGNSDNMVRRRSYALSDSYILGYGRPAYDGYSRPRELPFADVPRDAWYYDALLWAYQNGITAGTGPATFSPDRPCTRAETVQMLYQFAHGSARRRR